MLELYASIKFACKLSYLLNTFYDLILLYNQDIHVVNFTNIELETVNVIIDYVTTEGRSVKLEALGPISTDSEMTLEFIWQSCKRAIIEAQSDPLGPFVPLD